METNDNQNGLTLHSENLQVSFFSTKESFEHVQRVATMFSKSDMIPKRYSGNIGNCIIALEMATRMGASPLMVMQNLDVILGKPGWSSKFLIATLNACGKFSPLRYEEDTESGGRTRAWAVDSRGEKCFGAWVSMEMAKQEGWIDKNGSKWKTMPELMRRYRAASFFVNQFAPEISMGLRTVEEIQDIPFEEMPGNNSNGTDKVRERIELLLKDVVTIAELNALALQIPPEHKDLYEVKKKELEQPNEEQPKFTAEINAEIVICETIPELNALIDGYPEFKNNKDFNTAINNQKIFIGKKLKGEKV